MAALSTIRTEIKADPALERMAITRLPGQPFMCHSLFLAHFCRTAIGKLTRDDDKQNKQDENRSGSTSLFFGTHRITGMSRHRIGGLDMSLLRVAGMLNRDRFRQGDRRRTIVGRKRLGRRMHARVFRRVRWFQGFKHLPSDVMQPTYGKMMNAVTVNTHYLHFP